MGPAVFPGAGPGGREWAADGPLYAYEAITVLLMAGGDSGGALFGAGGALETCGGCGAEGAVVRLARGWGGGGDCLADFAAMG